MTFHALLTLALGMALSVMADTAARAVDAPTIATDGNDHGAAACSSCHGSNGEGSPATGFPRLAGLDASYLARQLGDFASGNRKSDIMGPIAQALDPDERNALASFYAGMNSAKADDEIDTHLAAAGAVIAQHGDWPNGVPGCNQCHGPMGEGVGASFPALAGQSSMYIASQLAAWRSGERTGDPMHLMERVAKKLTEAEISEVAAYFASVTPARSTPQDGAP